MNEQDIMRGSRLHNQMETVCILLSKMPMGGQREVNCGNQVNSAGEFECCPSISGGLQPRSLLRPYMGRRCMRHLSNNLLLAGRVLHGREENKTLAR